MTRRAAVIFDFDGTLTMPYLDFHAIREEIGVTGPILEAIGGLVGAARDRAYGILHHHEWNAARNAELRSGAVEVLGECRRRGFAVGILTRNARPMVEHVLRRFSITVDTVHTREDGPVKPAPDGVLAVCAALAVRPRSSWMVGDYLFDIQAGKRAGTKTALVIGDREHPPYAHEADHVIRELPELFEFVYEG
jgi:HAD superfamily hydrolase (TIGR01549 family)